MHVSTKFLREHYLRKRHFYFVQRRKTCFGMNDFLLRRRSMPSDPIYSPISDDRTYQLHVSHRWRSRVSGLMLRESGVLPKHAFQKPIRLSPDLMTQPHLSFFSGGPKARQLYDLYATSDPDSDSKNDGLLFVEIKSIGGDIGQRQSPSSPRIT